MSDEVQDSTTALFEVASGLDETSRELFVSLVRHSDPARAQELLDRLVQFESFDQLLEEPGGLVSLVDDLEVTRVQAGLSAKLPRPAGVPDDPRHHEIPREIGPFLIIERIAEGGQGSVFRARQRHPERQVALKLMHKLGYLFDREMSGRFQREYHALALMNHQHIAKIFETGVTPEGFPFFTMEYIDGAPITAYCRNHALPLDQRLVLFLQVCEGVAHAHRKLILHRDLKPNNIMVSETEGEASVKIIDFGIAKGLDGSLEEEELVTRAAVIGTPHYMAPEQLEGLQPEPDTRMDIYALGVLLYELVTDEKPHDPARLEGLAPDEQLRHFREQDPPRPSSRLSDDRRPHRIDELDWIVLCAMARDPDARYPTVSALRDDLTAFMENRPVTARPPHPFYLFRKFMHRYRFLVAAASLVITSLATGLLLTLAAKQEAERERVRAENSFAALESVLTAPQDQGVNTRVIDLLQSSEMLLDETIGADPGLEARVRVVLGNTYFAMNLYDDAKRHIERAREVYRHQSIEEPGPVLRADYYLGRTLMRLGEDARAILLLGDTFHAQRATTGLDEDALETLADLLSVLFRTARFEEIDALLAENGDFEHRPDSRALAKLLHSVAVIRYKRNIGDPRPLFDRALEIQVRLLGETHANTLATMMNLAELLAGHDDPEEAERMYRTVLKTRNERLGADHELTIGTREKLAFFLLQQQRNLQEAAAEMRAVLRVRERESPEDESTLRALGYLARIEAAASRYDIARPLFEELAVRYTELGDTYKLLITRISIGNLLLNQERYEEAERIMKETFEASRTRYGETHDLTLTALINLAQANQELGDHKGAGVMFDGAIEQSEQAGDGSTLLILLRAFRAQNRIFLGDDPESVERELLSVYREALAGEYAYLDDVRERIARFYRYIGNEVEARNYSL